jgi:alpha-tubulin suppressor-like RCC1 family protein
MCPVLGFTCARHVREIVLRSTPRAFAAVLAGCAPVVTTEEGSTASAGTTDDSGATRSTGIDGQDVNATTADDGSNSGGETNGQPPTRVMHLVAGTTHTCALLDNGAVRCWGDASAGKLGYGNTDNIGDDESPAAAGDVDVGGPVVELALGYSHTCARLAIGTIRCWGYGADGQLGYGNANDIGDDETPASAGDVDIGGYAIALATGGDHSCALLDTGAARCWGSGFGGMLGYGNTNSIGDDETPASAGDVGIGGPVVALALGEAHSCARLEPDTVRCWGAGGDGQLGYGTDANIGDDETPASAGDIGLAASAAKLAAGNYHNCVILNTGTVRCWGWGDGGQLGYGNNDDVGDDETPGSAGDVDVGDTVVGLSAGGHTCALLASSAVRCWGLNLWGELGYGNGDAIGDDEVPASVGLVDVGGAVVELALGNGHTCALLETGAVRCWGSGQYGTLGYGNTDGIGDDETPASAGDVEVL